MPFLRRRRDYSQLADVKKILGDDGYSEVALDDVQRLRIKQITLPSGATALLDSVFTKPVVDVRNTVDPDIIDFAVLFRRAGIPHIAQAQVSINDVAHEIYGEREEQPDGIAGKRGLETVPVDTFLREFPVFSTGGEKTVSDYFEDRRIVAEAQAQGARTWPTAFDLLRRRVPSEIYAAAHRKPEPTSPPPTPLSRLRAFLGCKN